jgi:hypothetical protein
VSDEARPLVNKHSAQSLRNLCASAVKRSFSTRFLTAALIFLLPLFSLPFLTAQTPQDKPGFIQCTPNSPVPIDRWQGEYFNNRELRGLPSMVRNDGDGPINFDWGLQGPSAACGINVDDFSVRWTRSVPFGAGTYRFTITADDGARVFIDGQKHLDHWRDQQQATYSFEVTLAAGNHEIVFEYYEHTGSSIARLQWSSAPCIATVAPERWRGEYFNNRDLKGKPVHVRDDGDGSLDFDWNAASPASECSVAPDEFSVRWTRTVPFLEGVYRFNIKADDGVRLYIDRQLKLDRWLDQMASYTVEAPLAAGNHQIVLEYYDHTSSASVKLNWEQHPCFARVSPDHWRGEYFDNPALQGSPKMARDDGAGPLDFDFGPNSPATDCGVGADGFSARWARAVATGAGIYRFTATADDGIRVFIDGEKVIDEWRNQQPANFIADVPLSAGNHRVVVEYYDHTGGAVAKLNWQLIARAPMAKRPR